MGNVTYPESESGFNGLCQFGTKLLKNLRNFAAFLSFRKSVDPRQAYREGYRAVSGAAVVDMGRELSLRSASWGVLMRLAKYIAGLVAALMLLTSSVSTAATLLVTNGILTGATGVIVNGKSYNVEFKDGTCAQVYTGCDQNSDFTFQTRDDAKAAGQALLDQVFLDGPLGQFDTKPELTAGCVGGFGQCLTLIPYAIYMPNQYYATNQTEAVWVRNSNSTASGADAILTTILGIGKENTTDFMQKQYAVFTYFPGVPEPQTWATMLLGFGFIGAAMRRRRRERANLGIA